MGLLLLSARTARSFSVVATNHHPQLKSTLMAFHSHHQHYSTTSYHGYHHYYYSNKRTVSQFSRLYSSSSNNDNDDNAKKIVYLGTPDVAATTLRRLHEASLASIETDQPWKVAAVVTQPPKRRRRKGQASEPSPVGQVALDLDLPCWTPASARDTDFLEQLEALAPDLCITAAYGQYLPKRFLQCPAAGTVNVHPSLLPRYRGASPVQRSLQDGANPVGVTVLYTVAKMDAGPIVRQTTVTLEDDSETAVEVLPKLFEVGTQDLIDALPSLLDGTMTMDKATPQDDDQATQAPLIQAHEAELHVWNHTATECHNQVRGFAAWPKTTMWLQPGTTRDPVLVKVLETRVVPTTDTDENNDPTVVKLGPTKQSGLYVTCYDGSVLEILRLQPATKKAFLARDFQNGYPKETIRWVRPPEKE